MRNHAWQLKSLVALAAVGALALAGCGGGDDKGGSGSDGDVTLEFWDMAWGPADTYPAAAEKLIAEIEKENPGIKVNYTNKSWDNWYQTFA